MLIASMCWQSLAADEKGTSLQPVRGQWGRQPSLTWRSAAARGALSLVLLILLPIPLMKGSPLPLQATEEVERDTIEDLGRALLTALRARQQDSVRQVSVSIMSRLKTEPDAVFAVGMRLAQEEFYEEASKIFSGLATEYPEVFETHYNLAMAEFAQANLAAALAALERAVWNSPEQESAFLYLRGKIRNAQGQTGQAERDLLAAVAKTPGESNYALDLGMFYVQHRDYGRAAGVFDKATALHRDSPFLLLGLSLAQLLGGRNEESIETSRAILRMTPNLPVAHLLLVFALYMNGRFEEAGQAASMGLKASEPHPYLYYLDAVILLKTQSTDHRRMLDHLGRAVGAEPKCCLCYVARGKVLEAIAKPEQAIRELEMAVSLDRTLSEAWYRLSRLYKLSQRSEDAVRALEQFNRVKTEARDREIEMVRDLFVRSMENGKPSAN